ncbi:O-antigen ligase family protein [Bacillus wiedmannii]|uniref:O-antigen ligase family protein n=1 Tax=Bacillus wiedmannii TaxID=1890302 RepID=UPI0012439D9B|nr:O-antigen ligase family protein [Bacillus wiedmannii]
MNYTFSNKTLHVTLLILSMIAISVLATFNITILAIMLGMFITLFLITIKKSHYFLFLSPFLTLSLVPSTFVPSLTFSTSIGTIRPTLILLLVGLIFFIVIIKGFKVDFTLVHENLAVINLLLLFFLMNLASIFINGFDSNNFRVSLIIFILSFVFFIFTLIFKDSINSLQVIKISIYISSLVSLIGIIEFFGIQPYLPLYMIDREYFAYSAALDGLPRVVSSIGNPIILSGYLLLCFPLVLYIRKIEKRKLMWDIIAILHIVCVMFTLSRSSMLTLAVASSYFIIKTEKIGKIAKNLFLAISLFLMFYLILRFNGLTQAFEERIFFDSNDISFDIRMQAYEITKNILQSTNPLFGIGRLSLGEYLSNNANFMNGTLENVFLTVLVGMGIIGLSILLGILFFLLRSFSKMNGDLKITGYCLFITFLGLSFFINLLPYDLLWGVFWFFSGLLLLHNNQINNK